VVTEDDTGLTEHPTLQLLCAEIPSATAKLLLAPELPNLKQRRVDAPCSQTSRCQCFSSLIEYMLHCPLFTILTCRESTFPAAVDHSTWHQLLQVATSGFCPELAQQSQQPLLSLGETGGGLRVYSLHRHETIPQACQTVSEIIKYQNTVVRSKHSHCSFLRVQRQSFK